MPYSVLFHMEDMDQFEFFLIYFISVSPNSVQQIRGKLVS